MIVPDFMGESEHDLARQVKELETFIGGKEYCAMTNLPRGKEFSVVIPWDRYYDTPIGLVMWRAVGLFLRALWGDLRSQCS